jgi:hypothetical protein
MHLEIDVDEGYLSSCNLAIKMIAGGELDGCEMLGTRLI